MKTQIKEKPKTLDGLNEKQAEAVTFGPGPLLIIAGAGTGKTTVLARRIAWLIEQGLAKPEEILALTFTEKAAGEMEERVDQLLPLGFVDVQISTFHAFAHKILSQFALDIGLPGDFKVITDTQAWILLKKHLNELDLDYYRPLGNPNKFLSTLIKHFGKAKGEEVSPAEYLEYADNLRLSADSVEIKKKAKKKRKKESVKENDDDDDALEAARIGEVAQAYHFYQKLLLDNSFLDFGDLINYTLKLFRTRPKILKLYQDKYKYILVDEFQDTDLSQYELVKLLSGQRNNLTVVGDDDQSIYKFRGASVSNILKFKEDYKNSAEITLTDNYRSNQPILDLAYNFIQLNNPDRLESKLKLSKKLISHSADTGVIEVMHTKTVQEEAKSIAEKIKELIQKESLTLNDFAILVRARDHAEPFLIQLAKQNIPYIIANEGLYKKPFILDLLAYLRILDDSHDTENFYRVLNFSKFRIADQDLVALAFTAKRKALPLYQVIMNARAAAKLSDDTYAKLETLVSLIDKHCSWARNLSASEVLVKILHDLGLAKEILEEKQENIDIRNAVEQFYKKSLEFEENSVDKSLKAWLNQIKLEWEAKDFGDLEFNPDLGPEAVKILTVHAAKGLEFKCVFVVNLVDQRFPSRERKDLIELPQSLVREIFPEGDAHLMEERRLFYVALTRAKTFLYLTWADDYGGAVNKKPSRFLVEIGLEKTPQKVKPLGEVFFVEQKILPHLQTEVAIPDTFSFSQMSCFEYCPLEYKYRYIYHLPLPGEAQLSFGDTIHKTLQRFLEAYDQMNSIGQTDLFSPPAGEAGKKASEPQIPSKELLHQFYDEVWVDDWYLDIIQKQRYRKRGLEMLDIFFERFKDKPKPIKFLERRFKLRIGDYKFVGKIDRADLNIDGSIDIIDYKTGAIKEKLSPDDKVQLLIYQWAATDEFKEKVNSLRYWYLASLRDSQEFVGSNEDIEKIKAKLLLTIEQIILAIKNNSFSELDHKRSHECKFRHLES